MYKFKPYEQSALYKKQTTNRVLVLTLTYAVLASGTYRVQEWECLLRKYEFASPFLYNESFVLAPVLNRKIWKTGFNLVQIDLFNNSIHVFPIFRKMIYLDSFANDTVYYYDSIDMAVLLSYSFHRLVRTSKVQLFQVIFAIANSLYTSF